MKVVQRHPVFGAILQLHAQQRRRLSRVQAGRLNAQRTQLANRLVQVQAAQDRGIRLLRIGDIHPEGDVLRRPPTMFSEIVGHAADGVGLVGPDVAQAVVVKVHRIVAVARGYELAVAHGTGIGALHRAHRAAFLARQEQELGQFVAEEVGPGRVVERQGREGVEHPMGAHDPAKAGFDADDGHDVFRRHRKALLGGAQRRLVFGPEGNALIDAAVLDEDAPVLVPLKCPFRRPRNRFDDARLVAGVPEGGRKLRPVEPMFGHQCVHVGAHVVPLAVVGAGWPVKQQGGSAEHDGYSHDFPQANAPVSGGGCREAVRSRPIMTGGCEWT